ncbi:hypothetical protein [Aneurinibacillus tyrosinisolvens]|nr:hypothetical protein [Aneurinibacillus tyrosinisolvens]
MEHFYLFFLTTIALVIAPGADTVLATKNTLELFIFSTWGYRPFFQRRII